MREDWLRIIDEREELNEEIAYDKDFDWINSLIYQKITENPKETKFNREYDKKLFKEGETEDVIEMIKSRLHDFKTTETLRPFYLKAINTLRELLRNEFSHPHLYFKYIN